VRRPGYLSFAGWFADQAASLENLLKQLLAAA
jgi:hypothetical protein